MTIDRRRFLTGATAVAVTALAGGWSPLARTTLAGPGCPSLAGFPAGVALFRQTYENWAKEIRVDDVWTCAPANPTEARNVVRWAAANGYRLRPRGAMHGWSPLVVSADDACPARTVMVDTGAFRAITVAGGPRPTVTVGTGATMEELLTALEAEGYGLTSVPAVGDVTVGGVLAVGGHGAAIPAAGERPPPGRAYGSVSDLVVAMTVIAHDGSTYTIRRVTRDEPDMGALLVHLGRSLVLEVTLVVERNYRLRCVSHTDVASSELFAPAASAGRRSFTAYLERAGRVETIWFPFTDHPWLKVWSASPRRPAEARQVTGPYNYPFSDTIPEPLSDLATRIVGGEGRLTPGFGQMSLEVSRASLAITDAEDLWGWSKDLLLYIRPSTMRVTASGHAVVVRRDQVQDVLARFAAQYQRMLAEHAAHDEYPVNMPFEARVSGFDDSSRLHGPDAAPPLLASTGRARSADQQCMVWFSVLTLTGTPGAPEFFTELERWLVDELGDRLRPEWSKGWAYTPRGAWSNDWVIGKVVGDAYPGWASAVTTLERLDPAGVFTNSFNSRLLRERPG